MKILLIKLANKLIKCAQQEAEQIRELSEYAEPWHEEATTEFGDNPITEDDYIEQNFKEEIWSEDHRSVLEENNFKTYISDNLELGEGGNGRVWRGIYNGKRAAAKVIFKQYGIQEIDVWKRILSVIDSLPPNLRKHLPEIYLLKKGEIDGKLYGLIIMEELKPLHENISEVLQGHGEQHQKNFEQLLNDPDYVYNIAKHIVKLIQEKSAPDFLNQKITAPEVFKILYGPLKYDKDSRVNCASLLSAELGKIHHLYPDEKYTIERLFYQATDSVFYSGTMPMTSDGLKDNDFWLRLPETKEYFEMLNTLEQYGIIFDDQHDGNVMLGQDDNLKLIDVGAFHVL